MKYKFKELDGTTMKVSEFLENRALMPSPLRIFLTKNGNDSLIKVNIESLESIPDLVGRFEVYEDNDGYVDHFVIIRYELWFIVDLDRSENHESF